MAALPAISPSGVFTAFQYPVQATKGAGYSSVLAAIPPSINTPVIFEPPPGLSGGDLLVWIIASGVAPNFGGCQVCASPDNSTYAQIGTIYAGQIEGTLTGSFPAGSDPDTTDTLAVDLTESSGQLIAGTTGDADDYLTLCVLQPAPAGNAIAETYELVAYSAASLTSAFHYSMGSYIRRGAYGTAITSHSAGSEFARIIGSTFSITFPSNLIGKTFYFKFPSFNATLSELQSLSAATAYSYTLTGAGAVSALKVRRVAQGSTTNLSAATDYLLEVISGSLADTTVNGPNSGVVAGTPGPRFEIHDKNDNAGTYPITFVPASPQTVEGAASYPMQSSNGAMTVTWDGVEWSVT